MDKALVLCCSLTVVFLLLALTYRSKSAHSSRPYAAFVINLAARKDRMNRFSEMYGESDLADVPLTRVEARSGDSVNDSLIDAESLEEMSEAIALGYRAKHRTLTPGAVGCYVSHVETWKIIADKTSPEWCIVFEDDAIVPKNGLQKMLHALRNAPKDWDMFLMGHYCTLCDASDGYLRVRRFQGTHAYAIRKSSAFKLLRMEPYPIKQQIDAHLSDLTEEGKLTVLAVTDQISLQDVQRFGTDIQTVAHSSRPGVDAFERLSSKKMNCNNK